MRKKLERFEKIAGERQQSADGLEEPIAGLDVRLQGRRNDGGDAQRRRRRRRPLQSEDARGDPRRQVGRRRRHGPWGDVDRPKGHQIDADADTHGDAEADAGADAEAYTAAGAEKSKFYPFFLLFHFYFSSRRKSIPFISSKLIFIVLSS